MNISSQYPIFSQLLKENLFPWLPIFNDIIIVCFFINLSGHRLASSILEENVDLEVHRMGKIITKFFLLETLFLTSPDKWHFNRHEIRPDKWPKACMCVHVCVHMFVCDGGGGMYLWTGWWGGILIHNGCCDIHDNYGFNKKTLYGPRLTTGDLI